jgi:hypothetical protein
MKWLYMRRCKHCEENFTDCGDAPMCYGCLDDVDQYNNWMLETPINVDEYVMKDVTKEKDSHYKGFNIQPTDYIISNNLGWCGANIVKYASRHEFKGGADDIRKIIRYAEIILAEKYS